MSPKKKKKSSKDQSSGAGEGIIPEVSESTKEIEVAPAAESAPVKPESPPEIREASQKELPAPLEPLRTESQRWERQKPETWMSSVFSTLFAYLRDVLSGVGSVWSSCWTSLPYLFSAGEFRKEVTEQYPDPISSKTVDDLPPRSRGLLFNDIDRCTGCKECEKACPTQCIHIETEPGADDSKIWVSIYDLDFSKCIFCGLCVEVCHPKSLVHTKQYEGAVFMPLDLIARFGRGHVTAEHREKWQTMRRQAEEDEEGFQ
jgi:formate hydrogenlyase subunit 6/NADH:ubiquinone oxidoreductase subunit I